MADNKNTDGFDAISDLWQQSQDAFLRAQQEIGDHFQKSLQEMAGTLEKEATDPLAAWQSLIKAWVPVWNPDGKSSDLNPFDMDFSKGQAGFFELLDPQKWTKYAPEQLRVMLEQIAKGPQFADLAMPQQQLAGAWRESVDYQEAASDMSRVMQNAWSKAYQDYSQSHSLEDLQSGQVNEALDSWLKSANSALLEAQGSSEFLDAQKRMIRASTEIRARQRDLAESWSEAWQIPTRSELDDLTLIVHQLRRELRETKRELSKLKEAQK